MMVRDMYAIILAEAHRAVRCSNWSVHRGVCEVIDDQLGLQAWPTISSFYGRILLHSLVPANRLSAMQRVNEIEILKSPTCRYEN